MKRLIQWILLYITTMLLWYSSIFVLEDDAAGCVGVSALVCTMWLFWLILEDK